MSSFAWMDFSAKDHERALEVLDLFREKDTRDELGIATVRDAISDLLFPGTSTIQTRARYFLFVPWIYRSLENRRVPSSEIADKAKTAEVRLMDHLLASTDTSGVIGSRARSTIKRLPSAIYWQGLGRLGIRHFHGSRDQYHRALDRFYVRGGAGRRNDDGELVDRAYVRNWDSGLPELPKGFPEDCTISLQANEARYLQERLMLRAPKSLLAHLLHHTDGVEEQTFPWLLAKLPTFPARNQIELLHARNFSECINGAALLYNLMLAELRHNEKIIVNYTTLLDQWARMCEARQEELKDWDLDAFWRLLSAEGALVPSTTRKFVSDWLALVRTGPKQSWNKDYSARRIVHERERFLKRRQARLDGGTALDLWGGAAGAGRLDFRWGRVVRQFVVDVKIAIGKGDARAA